MAAFITSVFGSEEGLLHCYTPAHNAKIKGRILVIVVKNNYRNNTMSTLNEVHLRQLTVDEALLKLDKYLNDAFMAGLYQVRIIHGKGTGILRQVVQEQLSSHSLGKSYRLGGYGEGGAGVTIVELALK